MAAVTIKDIARQLEISAATVSMALNDRPGVNPQTKQRVLDLVKQLNYTGGTAKKASQSNGVISFLVYKRYGKILGDTQFFADLIEAVEKAARAFDYTVALAYCTGKESFEERIKPVLAAQPEGLIVLGTEMTEEDLKAFEAVELPIVVLDSDLFGRSADTVTIHNEDGVWRAVEYLYAQGHREIGYLKSSFPIRNFEQRSMGFEFALKKWGLHYNEEYIFMMEPTVEGACDDVCALLEHNIKLPTAIVADNDLIALGALKGFLQNGIKVPDHLSLIGFDDIPMASIFEPALTTVCVSREALGRSAVEQLLWRIAHMDAPFRRVSIGTRLTLRGSVKPL